ncbi:iron ABC transporter ATP-binding protein [Sulfolobus acidocaldarius SUSAZ]|nr:iron ABC transporter ATP-binding protein [Sulfolobus acidocaldarius SUSAZ]
MIVKGLKVKLGKKIVLDNVNIELKPGITAILGPNGSGKTTLLKTIIGMIEPTEGKVIVNENLSYSPAEFYTVNMKTIDVILAGRKKGEYQKYIELFNIADLMENDFQNLSSGQKRLILIVKALGEGDVVIMDEPFANLDMKNRIIVLDALLKLKSEKNFIITSHELEVVNYADEIILIKKGKVVYLGSKENISDLILSEVYDVRIRSLVIAGRRFFFHE